MQPSFAWIPPPPLNWSTFPLLLPAVAFGLGIGAANWISYWWPPYAPLALLTLAFCCVFLVLKRWKSPTTRQAISITLLCLIALTGYWRASSFHLPNQPAFFGHFLAKGEGNTLLVSIKDIKPGERHLRLISSVKAVIKDQKASSTKGELIIYLPPDRRAGELVPGDQLMLRGEIGTVENPRNPKAFNFATYWGKKNIFHRVFIRDPMQWQMVQEGSPNLLHAAKILRERWIASFRPYLTGNELAVAAALVLGKRDLLSDEIRSAYADTGAVHVLAVSGLHVGIVAWVVSWLLGRVIPKRYWARYVRTGLSIVFVWAFALLTGFGPSVQRAAWMFSILLLGGALRRKTYLFNSLAAAALLMLLMDPLQLFQVGFQLSFGAVAGIGLFQQKIQKALYFPNKIARLVCSTLSVSLAAQIGILPLSIYYFHQFPTYFLLTGSIVILTAYGALIIGLLHGIIAWLIPVAAGITGWLLSLVVSIQNAIVFYCQKLPNATQALAWIDPWQVLLLFVIIACTAIWLQWRKFTMAVFGLLLLVGYGFFRLTQVQSLDQQQSSVVYHVNKGSLLDFAAGRTAISIGSDALTPENTHFSAAGYRAAKGYTIADKWPLADTLMQEQLGLAYRHGALTDALGSRWYLPTSDAVLPSTLPPVDFWLLQPQHGYFEVSALLQAQNEDDRPLLIIDGSFPFYELRAWQQLRDSTQLPIHITAIDGAFEHGKSN